MTDNELLVTIRKVDENLYSVEQRIGFRLLSSGYYTNYKIDNKSPEFIMVYLYNNNRDKHSLYHVADKVEITSREIILPKKTLQGLPLLTWIDPNSSNIFKFQYDNQSNELYIIFHSNKDCIYKYLNVPDVVFRDMFNSSSKGSYFHYNIKGFYLFEKEYL